MKLRISSDIHILRRRNMLVTRLALLVIVIAFGSSISCTRLHGYRGSLKYDDGNYEFSGVKDVGVLDVADRDTLEDRDLLDVIDGQIAKRGALKLAGHKFTAGVKAMRTLLSGARAVAPTDILRREYVKSGGIERAISDFYSVNPKNIRAADDQKILLGEIGDKTILLMRPGAEGPAKPSSLIIYKTDERDLPYSFYDKIIYHG